MALEESKRGITPAVRGSGITGRARRDWWTLILSSAAAMLTVALLIKTIWPGWLNDSWRAAEVALLGPQPKVGEQQPVPTVVPQPPMLAKSELPSEGSLGLDFRKSRVKLNAVPPTGLFENRSELLTRPRKNIPALNGFRIGPIERGFPFRVKTPQGAERVSFIPGHKGNLLGELSALNRQVRMNRGLIVWEAPSKRVPRSNPRKGLTKPLDRPLLGLAVWLTQRSVGSKNILEGLLVERVLPKTPAARTKIRRGDYITDIGSPKGTVVVSFRDSSVTEGILLLHVLRSLGSGKKVRLDYQRLENGFVKLRSEVVTLVE